MQIWKSLWLILTNKITHDERNWLLYFHKIYYYEKTDDFPVYMNPLMNWNEQYLHAIQNRIHFIEFGCTIRLLMCFFLLLLAFDLNQVFNVFLQLSHAMTVATRAWFQKDWKRISIRNILIIQSGSRLPNTKLMYLRSIWPDAITLLPRHEIRRNSTILRS